MPSINEILRDGPRDRHEVDPPLITVKFSASLRDLTGDDDEVQIDAPTVRRLIKVLDDRYPGIGERLSEGTSVAINGEILPDALYEDIPDGAEVHFLATLAGG